ncbi:ATP-binding protein [Thiomicrorhabdus aquaedulcis]|uniref:ATP-binding protein n=1 Tax=Thiomicrorhabdus aquaedulcis TaxID=2211106 RepID=UPI000FDCCB40|nr:ATP-binding protein [Thiomicrorhabdus aquaedulcis]
MKKLPIGVQTFSAVRNDNFIYIDKTPLVWQMVQQPSRYFLSRPRRFGKSLLVDTFKELFEGNKALFEGLFIYDKWDWSKTYPVIKLDFANGVIESRAGLDQTIYNLLAENQRRLNIECQHFNLADPAGCLMQLIVSAAEKYGQKVVVLVDEYDKPILDNIDNPEISAQVREGLKNVYSVLKGQDAYLQFVFMTGVTKFSKVSLFSGLNQLQDITLSRDFATLCGYTQNDLQTSFAEHLAGVNWDKLKEWYNGYQFLGEPVYNPFDVLLFIANHQTYRNYWFETGSPSFLLKLFRKERYFLPDLEGIEVGEEILDSFEIEAINPITLLYQAGYLTIKQVTEKRDRLRYHLDMPNKEVKLSLADQLVDLYTQTPGQYRLGHQDNLFDAFEAADFTALTAHIQSLFASIPWRNFTKNDMDSAEGYYASVMFAYLSSLNAQITAEDTSNHGQVDLTVKLAGQLFIMEFKLDKSVDYQAQTPNPALQQIINKQYAQKHQAWSNAGKPIYLLGFVFNQTARNLVQLDWAQV